jgi:hypothetical protein
MLYSTYHPRILTAWKQQQQQEIMIGVSRAIDTQTWLEVHQKAVSSSSTNSQHKCNSSSSQRVS